MRKEPEPQPIHPMVEVALGYAARNWCVFPLQGKIPFKGTNGLKDGTTDPLLIQAMWSMYPNANIGLQTGRASGIIILDIDPRHNGNNNLDELQRRYGKLPSTLLSRTPRGGIHRYYRHPKDGEYGNAVQLDGLPGLDVRGDNGYVVIPPSTLFGGKAQYKWVKSDFPIAKAPQFLLELLKKKQSFQTESQYPTSKGDKWLESALQRASEGNRNAVGFYLACQLRDDGISESEARSILLEYAHSVQQGKTVYREAEALASLRSAYSRSRRDPARRK